MRGRRLAISFLFLVSTAAFAQTAPDVDLPRVAANDNRTAAGHFANGALELRLDLRRALWYPGDDHAGHLNAYAFAEEGGRPQIPGPLIRVPQGTLFHIHVHNSLPFAAKIYGLHAHPGDPGTYFYWATTSGKPMEQRDQDETLLSGAFIVE